METQSFTEKVGQMAENYQADREGPIAKAIEKQTARLPSDFWLWAAGVSIVGSLVFQGIGMFGGRRVQMAQLTRPIRSPIAQFVGMWAPTFLLFGLYNKIVKVAGSDRYDPAI